MGISTVGYSCGMPAQAPAAPAATPLTDLSSLVPALQQLTTALTQLVSTLATQATAQAQAGAAASGCGDSGCSGGATGASEGAQLAAAGALGSAPAPTSPDPIVQSTEPTQSSSRGAAAVREAMSHLGKPYRAGAAGPDSFDCSGLTMEIYRRLGITLPHKAALQAKMGTKIGRQDLQPGDLVFFSNPEKGIHHVGIYIGDGKFIHAPKTGDVVKVSSLNEPYYAREFASASRYI